MNSQPEFDFSAPIQTRGSLRTQHASAMGALKADERMGRQMVLLLTAYRQHGPLTDAEMAERIGIQRSTVIPRRRELMARGLVVEVGHRKNPQSGVTNTTFGLA